MRTPEEVAREYVARFCPAPDPCQSCLDDSEDLADLIRARDVEMAEQARAEALAPFVREDVAPFHGHGHTQPGYWRLVGPKHYLPLPPSFTDAEWQAIREHHGLTEPEGEKNV